MHIKSIELKNYRNYENLSLGFDSDKILLVGKNAQGKTNLLEAIYYMSCLSSARAKNDSDIISWGKDFLRVKLEMSRQDMDSTLEVVSAPPKKREMFVNGVKKRKTSEFCSNLSVVSFAVNDLLLLRGTPDDRRGWLDMAISQIYPAYLDRIAKYNKIRVQKGSHLREIKGNLHANRDILDVLNTQLIVAGSNIIYLRLKFLRELQKIAKQKHLQIAEKEDFFMEYNSSVIDTLGFENEIPYTIEDIAFVFDEKLKLRQDEEIIRAQAVVGPHRDDIFYYINGIDSRKFASQGQQRTIVLSLKLAELELIKEKIGDTPVLLLDDVLAELDNIRQNYLLNAIGTETQTIITSVDTVLFDNDYLKNVEVFNISGGQIVG